MSRGSGRLVRRGNVWWIDFGHRGKRYRESSGSTRKKDAQELLRRRMAEIAEHGRPVGRDAERVTLADLWELLRADYKKKNNRSLDRTELAITHINTFFGGEDTRAVDVTAARVDSYAAARMDDVSGGTVARELSALRRAFRLAVKRRMLPTAPAIDMPEGSGPRQGFLDGEALERVIGELPDYLGPVVRFAALTGWRKGEVLTLTWAQVDFQAGEVRLEPGTTKNSEGRTFPFGAVPPLVALLETQRERTRALERERGTIITRVFHRDGHRIKSMRTAWDGACRRAGVPDAIFHDLRRTAVRNLERAGVSRSVAMQFTGHLTQSIYARYAIADSKAQQEGAAKLAAFLADTGETPATASPVVPLKRRRKAQA